jgi:alpha-tubulin suppressor-like RCC1 family protein
VAVTKLLTLRSVNGPEVTVIQGYQVPGTKNGNGAVRCVYLGDGAALLGFTLTNGATRDEFVDSQSERSGGGIWCTTLNVVVSNCVLVGNSASLGGGAYQGTLHNCTLTGNSAEHLGGGAAYSTLNTCMLSGNSAQDAGGGAYGARLSNCTLTSNTATYNGGGASSSALNNCTLTGNSANYGGGAAESTLANCTLTGNRAYEGGGAFSGALNNCTLTGNSAEIGGGGVAARVLCIQNFCSGHAILHNCIVYFNQAQIGANYSDSRFEYSCTTPLPTGTGNIDSDPGFVDFAAGNLRLLSCSPCIDVGDAAFASGGFDLNGTRRIIGDTVDMGAFEFDQTQWILSNSIAIASAAIDHDGHFRVHLSSVSVGAYYILDRGTSIDQIRTPVAVALATNCDGVELVDPGAFTTQARAFYRIRGVPRTQPLDLDHDGIDDYYELRHAAFLNPFNPADAAQDTDGDGYSNLAEYRAGTDPASLTGRHSIASGLDHTVVLKRDGSLWAWGDNICGQLGDGTYETRTEPVRIGTDTDWISVSAGRDSQNGDHTVALKRDGSLWAWGANTWGQLGYPPDQVPGTNVPVRVGNSSVWVDVSAGGGYIAALQRNGSLWMWGNNNYGIQPCCNPTWTPTRVGPDTDWTTISAGGQHILALKADRSLWAWGGNTHGQCGLGEGVGPGNTPTRVGTDNDWIAIAASGDVDPGYGTHSLALKADGSLWSWGSNDAGELGLGNSGFIQFTPARVGTNSDWVAVAAGSGTSLARKRDGSLWAWGNGIGMVPARASTRHDWRDFAAGRTPHKNSSLGIFAHAVAADGALWAWSFVTVSRVPVQVGTETNWTEVAAGGVHSLALKLDGSLWSWGGNEQGQLGDGTFSSRSTPSPIASNMTCRTVSAGGLHTVALLEDGTLWTWGDNDHGQLGIGLLITNGLIGVNTPQPVATNGTWQSVAAGGRYTAALRADGSLWTWGQGGVGQLGNGAFGINLESPFSVEPGATWRAVSAGACHTIGLRSDGSLWACGDNSSGELGLGFFTTDAPYGFSTLQRIPTNVMWKSITAGGFHSVALSADGRLWSWGENSAGQLGNGSFRSASSPQLITADKTWKAVAAGGYHTVGLDSAGTLWTWGSSYVGQLGIGSSDNSMNTPQPVQLNTTWKTIAAGANHTLAIREDGTLWSWGLNDFGQLGIPPDLTPTRLGTDTDWGSPP